MRTSARTTIRIADVHVQGRRVRISHREVDDFESQYWLKFPRGYREYVTSLGEGVLGKWIRIYPPKRISRELDDWRNRIRKHWFWNADSKSLPKPRAFECIILGDTIAGDELMFHPRHPDRLFVLPREAKKIFEAGSNLLSAINWMCASGKLVAPFDDLNFEPFSIRSKARRDILKQMLSSNQGRKSFDEIVSNAASWAKQNRLLKRAAAKIKSPLKNLPLTQICVTPRRQSVIFLPEQADEPSFSVQFDLSIRKTGMAIASIEAQLKQDGEFDLVIVPDPLNWKTLSKKYGGEAFDDFE